MKVLLSQEECEFEASSVVDPVGRLFSYQGRIFRAISPQFCDFVLDTLDLAEEKNWFDLGLVFTQKTDYSFPGFPLILEHRRVPFVTVRSEWSAEGLREATLCCLRLATAVAESNLCLKDAHPWNFLFNRATPYMIDWGSIRPISELDWDFWYFQFRKYFLVPLYLFSIGQHRFARALLREHSVGVGNSILDLHVTACLPEQPYQIFQRRTKLLPNEVYDKLADYVSGLSLPPIDGEWVKYEQPRFVGADSFHSPRRKESIIYPLMRSDPGKTVLDFGCNFGLHSQICAALGKCVIAADIEETCINDLFLRVKQQRDDILTLYLDFLWPMGESGMMNSIPAVDRRLACDTVLVLALVHHLVFKHHASFESIARNISRFSKARAIVEFVPSEDHHVAQWSPEQFSWYTLDNFATAMRKYFRRFDLIPGDPEPRKVLVFEDKRSHAN